jgi:hypothetical protein
MDMEQRLVTLAAAASLFGCATMAATSDHDPTATFTGLKTYAWFPDPERQDGDPRRDDPLVDAAVEKLLQRVPPK